MTVSLAIDIGGTFTDAVLELGKQRFTAKVLTTKDRPEEGFLAAAAKVIRIANLQPNDVDLVIHGTTLATNAIIERTGAKTALIATDGFTDSLEIAYEHRFEQSDLFMERPKPLVPRHLRLGIKERIASDGSVLIPLDENSVKEAVMKCKEEKVEAIAIGFLHCYANDQHEKLAQSIAQSLLPDIPISLSSQVSPEIREYDRLSTTVANAYILPLMQTYLKNLGESLKSTGYSAPLLMMMSSGGMTTLETAQNLPIRLVESGPAGGAILSRIISAECGLKEVLSFDMGGTTAKICYIDDYNPQYSREFEVAREYRFLKGSGFPLRIPVIDMVEIGAGGGSIATVDQLSRIRVGPESAGSNPGPASYNKGGDKVTVTDADLIMGRINPADFANGEVELNIGLATHALKADIAIPLKLTTEAGASGISQIVDENMANAASVHAIELGKRLDSRVMIAFGGAAPLHACQLAETLNIKKIIIPSGAGVGSAIGFLKADIAYEVARSFYMDLRSFEPDTINNLFETMRSEAEEVVKRGTDTEQLTEKRTAFMRYRGQGHEIPVPITDLFLTSANKEVLVDTFEAEYERLFGRIIPNLTAEVMTWSLTLSTNRKLKESISTFKRTNKPKPTSKRRVFSVSLNKYQEIPTYQREFLAPGNWMPGPNLITENGTSTYVSENFCAYVNNLNYLELTSQKENS
ncbi:MAG: hydantoinase/oxoprolinase family protein [Nisaea sp.]|nr:hydantoinase/oxoprolinase family protein [Nisaea sp.]|tara:strand:- start:5039 stop:7117 length:2079 start_codon:yes stop_codon:yes gene_type:complete